MKSINRTQKVILFTIITIVLFFVSYPIAVEVSTVVVRYDTFTFTLNDAFDFKYTWYVWAIYTLIVGTIGFFMYRNKPK